MKNKISYSKIVAFILILIVSATFAFYAQPLMHGNEAAINVIVTVFSILAGFLVAIIAVVGDPALLPPGSWRSAEIERVRLDRRLIRHRTLFMAYLLTLGLVFLSLLASKSYSLFNIWLERVYLFLGMLAFVYSLRLPGVLIDAQRERINSIIENRRELDKTTRSGM